MSDSHDPIFESFLAEALEQAHPPDVVESVLAEWRRTGTVAAGPLPTHRREAAPRAAAVAAKSNSWWWSLAGIVLLGFALGLILLGLDAWQRRRLALQPTPRAVAPSAAPQPVPAEQPPRRAESPAELVDNAPRAPRRPEVAIANPAPESRSVGPIPDRAATEPANPPRKPTNLNQLVARIDAGLVGVWRAHQIEPAPRIARQAWAARVVDTLQPNAAERAASIALLCEGTPAAALESYFQTYGIAANATVARRIADRILLGRQVAQPTAAQALQNYLAQAWSRQLPWNELIRGLLDPPLAPQGDGTLHRGESAALLTALAAAYGPHSAELVDHVGRVFLQSPLGCARCHDGPPATGLAATREQFWQFAAYFQQLGTSGTPPQLRKQNFLPDGRSSDQDAPLFFEQADGRLAVAYPTFAGRPEPLTSGLWQEFDRLAAVAQHIAAAPECAAAGVDWIWEALLGYPLVGNPSAWPLAVNESFEPLRTELAAELIAQQDWTVLGQAILLSEAFWRDAAPVSAATPDLPYYGTPAFFSHAYPRVPRRGTVDAALAAVVQEYNRGKGPAGIYARIVDLTTQPTPPTANDGSVPEPLPDRVPRLPSAANSALPDNGLDPLEREWGVAPGLASLLQHIATSAAAEEVKIRHFFWIGVGRDPSASELEHCRQILVLATEPDAGFHDLWAAIWLSNEVSSQ